MIDESSTHFHEQSKLNRKLIPCCYFKIEGGCRDKDQCPYAHVRVDEISRIRPSLVATFGWKHKQDPSPGLATDKLLQYFEDRLELPGKPRVLKIPLPQEIKLDVSSRPVELLLHHKYGLPPLAAMLLVLKKRGYDWSGMDFIGARAAIKAFYDKESELLVQRGKMGPTFLKLCRAGQEVNLKDLGHRFEDALLTPPSSIAETDAKSAGYAFRIVVYVKIGPFKVLMSGETDGVTDKFQDLKQEHRKSASQQLLMETRELKTCRDKLAPYRLPEIFLQSFLAGVPTIIVGTRKTKTTVTADGEKIKEETGTTVVREVATKSLLCRSKQRDLLEQTMAYLQWINDTVPRDNQVYRVVPAQGKIALADKDTEPLISSEMLKLI